MLAAGLGAALTAGVLVSVALGQPWWPVLVVFGAYALVIWPSRALPAGPGLGLANTITLGRGALVGLLATFAWAPPAEPMLPFAVAAVAYVLDYVDGFIAKATGSASELGGALDMELDALVVVVLSALVWRLDHAGIWILAGGTYRYLFVLAGVPWAWMRRPLEPFWPRRYTCGLMVGCLVLALAVSPPLSAWICVAALGVLTASFARDVHWLWSRR